VSQSKRLVQGGLSVRAYPRAANSIQTEQPRSEFRERRAGWRVRTGVSALRYRCIASIVPANLSEL